MADEEKRPKEYERVYTVDEVARILRHHPRTIRIMIQKGEIPAFKVGKEWRIHKSTLDGLMRLTNDKAHPE